MTTKPPINKEPEWPAFAARIKREAPALMPDENDKQWQNLHAIYCMGFDACLDILKDEFKDEWNKLPANCGEHELHRQMPRVDSGARG